MCLLVEVVDVSHKFDWVNNLFVLDKHTGDLASMSLVLLLDDRVDNVSNFLATCIRFLDGIEFIYVHKCGRLLLLLLSHHCCLIRWHVLTSLHHNRIWHSLVLLLDILWLASHTLGTILIWSFKATSLAHIWLSSSHLSATSASVVLLIVLTRSSVHPLTTTILLILHTHASSLWAILHVEVFHEVLLNLLETPLLSFGVKLRWALPELNRKGSCTERCGLIKLLNCGLSTIDILIEDEVLSVSCRRVEVLSLSKLDRDDRTTLVEELYNFFFLDLSWDVLNKEIRFVSLLHTVLDWATSAGFGNLIFAL